GAGRGVDAGYRSGLVRSRERAGLVKVSGSRADMRVRTARLTRAGSAERTVLDQRSDALAASFLEPLADADRLRLLAAMTEVEKLLAAAMLKITLVDPEHPDAQHCLREYFAEINRRFERGFDPAHRTLPSADAMRRPAGLFLVAYLQSEPIGCGGLRVHGTPPPHTQGRWVARPG